MNNGARQSLQSVQTVRHIQIGDDRRNAGLAQFGHTPGLTGHGKDTEAVTQERQQTHANVAAADQQKARSTHIIH